MVVGIKDNADAGGRTVLEATEVSLITNEPALIESIIAVIALIAYYHSLSSINSRYKVLCYTTSSVLGMKESSFPSASASLYQLSGPDLMYDPGCL